MSGRIYEEKIRFTYSDFDIYDMIKPSVLQRYFQDAAGKHADILGVGYADMIKQGALWIISKLHIVISGKLIYDTEYTLRTWPHKKRLIYFPREYEIIDGKGEVVVKCLSTWHIFSDETRSIISLAGLNLGMLEGVEKIPSNFNASTIDFPREMEAINGEERLVHRVVFTDLDHNGHMNNTNYSDLAQNSLLAIDRDDFLQEYKIIFLNECGLGEKIKTYYISSDEEEYIRGEKDGKAVFMTSFRYRREK